MVNLTLSDFKAGSELKMEASSNSHVEVLALVVQGIGKVRYVRAWTFSGRASASHGTLEAALTPRIY